MKTKLTDEQHAHCLGIVLKYLLSNRTISNKQLRMETQIGYDQAIHFFGKATAHGHLRVIGSGGGTKYELKK